jgi:hypothetical protein
MDVFYKLYYLLEAMKIGSEKTFLLHLKALGALHPLMLHKLLGSLSWGPISHGILYLCLHSTLVA